MSSAYSSDEFNALLALAHRVRKELVGAPSQFKEISDKFVTLIIHQQMLTTRYNRVSTLSNVLQDIDGVSSSQSELDNEQRTDLQRITTSCRSILIDLEDAVDNDDELGSSHGDPSETLKRVGKRKIWKPSDIRDLQDRITINSELLDAYLKRISDKDSVKSKDNDYQLLRAVQRNEVDKVKQLLDRGANIESKVNYDQTPLCWAIQRNNVDMVKLLLDAGADVKSIDDHSQTPLYWAVQRNNVDIVKLLLAAGADVKSKDEDDQRLLWRALLINNVDIVKLLLDRGANIDSKDKNNKTPLLWAARNGNIDVVKLLLDAGADVNSKDVHNRTPLWWAAWNDKMDIAKLLLYAGADVNSKDVHNRTPLHFAVQGNKMDMVKLLLNHGANIESKDKYDQTLLCWVVQKNNVDMVKLLLDRGADVGSQDNDQTPLWWAAQSSNEHIFKLLLNAGANVESNDNNDQTPTAGPDALREAIGQFDVQAVEDLLTQAFTDVARDDLNWLHELVEIGYGYQDIAKLLVDEKESPWIFIEPIERSNSGIIMNHHQAFCVHQGGDEVKFSPRLMVEDEAIRHIGNCHKPDLTEMDSIKRQVATSCGLAGVIPILNDRQGWIDAVAFDGDDLAVASVAYDLDLSHTTSTIQDCLLRVEAALERLVDIVSWLQQNGLCCNSFTILKLSTEFGRVELIQVPFSLISLLVGKVSYLRSSERDREIIDSALKVAQEILDLVYGEERDGTTPLYLNTLDMESAEKTTIHNCALATQSLCLGLLLYSNAHAGPIQPFFLSRALKSVQLLGIGSSVPNEQRHSADLVELTCFGQMIENAVVAFSCAKTPTPTRKYDLLASPEDLVDTWGPGRFIKGLSLTKVERLYAIEIGGGVIRPTAEDTTRFHWEKGMLDYEGLSTQFDSYTKILIAATRLNESCPLDQSRSWPVCNRFMENLGTGPDYWRLAEIQAGFQAGQYVMLQFNSKWVKQDGITLKDLQLNATPETIYLPFLESLLGLQVSLCTGVARRVPVREMLADVMEAYVAKRLPVPTLWNDLLDIHKIVDNFQGPHMETWFHNLSDELQTLVVRIVRYILGILGDTGYNEQRNELVIACPFPEDPFRCFRIPCKEDQHLWTRALADSESCATFAYITPKCWDEPNGLKCQQSCVAKWRNRVVSLDTAVCQHKGHQAPQDQKLIWILKPGIPYWIGKPGSRLKAKVLEPTTQLDMRLSITQSSIPESIRRRIARFPIHRIREKQQTVELNATPVLILTGHPSPPACSSNQTRQD